MRIIIGLGNPGTRYKNTRHNVGFLFLDSLAQTYGVSFQTEKKFQAEIAELITAQEKILLVKPLTFMNNSGEAIGAILRYYKLTPADILVIHDDLDVQSGTYKLTASSRSAGNNGVQSIIDILGTQEFSRIRIGIGRPTETLGACMPSHDYVLAPFSPDEQTALETLFPEIQMALKL